MGISLVYYRLAGKDKLSDYSNLNAEIESVVDSEVDLDKMYSDFAVILTKSIDFDDYEGKIEFKLIFGNVVNPMDYDGGQVNGFIPPLEVKEIDNWIKQNKLNTEIGFLKYYNSLDEEIKEELESWGTPDKEELFEIFEDVVIMYDLAAKNGNSIITCGR